jgi:hypothetical protein
VTDKLTLGMALDMSPERVRMPLVAAVTVPEPGGNAGELRGIPMSVATRFAAAGFYIASAVVTAGCGSTEAAQGNDSQLAEDATTTTTERRTTETIERETTTSTLEVATAGVPPECLEALDRADELLATLDLALLTTAEAMGATADFAAGDVAGATDRMEAAAALMESLIPGATETRENYEDAADLCRELD